jgi:hypothetical protein
MARRVCKIRHAFPLSDLDCTCSLPDFTTVTSVRGSAHWVRTPPGDAQPSIIVSTNQQASPGISNPFQPPQDGFNLTALPPTLGGVHTLRSQPLLMDGGIGGGCSCHQGCVPRQRRSITLCGRARWVVPTVSCSSSAKNPLTFPICRGRAWTVALPLVTPGYGTWSHGIHHDGGGGNSDENDNFPSGGISYHQSTQQRMDPSVRAEASTSLALAKPVYAENNIQSEVSEFFYPAENHAL